MRCVGAKFADMCVSAFVLIRCASVNVSLVESTKAYDVVFATAFVAKVLDRQTMHTFENVSVYEWHGSAFGVSANE